MMDVTVHGVDINGVQGAADLYVVYPSRDYLPERTKVFIEMLVDYFKKH